MNFALGALRQLTAEGQVIRQRAELPPVNAQHACVHLSGTLHAMRQKLSVVKLDRPKLDAERVWSAFTASKYDIEGLDGLQFRTLCSDENTAFRPEFIAALTRNPERLKRSRCLYGMVNVYFSEWRNMNDPAALERLLISVFSNYGGKNPVAEKWHANKPLFSEQAATFLADKICSGQKAVDDVLKDCYVGLLTGLGQSVRASAATNACEYLRRTEASRDNEWSFRYLKWMTESVLSDLTTADAFYGAIGSLILSESAKRSESFQRALRVYIQNHKRLGDPRVRESSLHWRSIVPEAAQRYLSWLARDSILFFYNTILPNNSENRSTAVTWSMSPGVGTLNASTGVYTAPTVSSPTTTTITATSTVDSSVSGFLRCKRDSASPSFHQFWWFVQCFVLTRQLVAGNYVDGSGRTWYTNYLEPSFYANGSNDNSGRTIVNRTGYDIFPIFSEAYYLGDSIVMTTMKPGNYLVQPIMYWPFTAAQIGSPLVDSKLLVDIQGQLVARGVDLVRDTFNQSTNAITPVAPVYPATVGADGRFYFSLRKYGSIYSGPAKMAGLVIKADPGSPHITIDNPDGPGSNVGVGTAHNLYCVGWQMAGGCTFTITSGSGTITTVDGVSATYTAPTFRLRLHLRRPSRLQPPVT